MFIMKKSVLRWHRALAYWQKLLNTQDPMLHSNQGLERGLLRAFRTVMGFRLLLWLVWGLILRLMDMRRQLEPLAFDPQTLVITALLDGLLLVVLLWPSLRPKIGPRHFGWLLAISSAVLFYGHASVLAFRGIEGALLATIFFTPYSILLFMNILFVAWQFDLRAVLLYSGVVLGMLLLLLWQPGFLAIDRPAIVLTIMMVFVTLFIMLLPGWLIAHLMFQQRQQRAALAAAAEEQARTNEQLIHYAASLEELTISRERNRLARELHDTLAHSLSAVTVQLGAVETLWDSSPAAAKGLLAQADESARSGLAEARRALQALRASPLEDLGLVLAIRALAEDAAARANAKLHLDLPAENVTFLEPHIEQSIYRVAQEALENCVRHAEAKTLWVKLTYSSKQNQTGQIQLTMSDDGQGFDSSQAIPRGHYGVAGMKERANVIGGTLQVESSPGEGTTVQLVAPLMMSTEMSLGETKS
jgi:signal transduction histidine kinase